MLFTILIAAFFVLSKQEVAGRTTVNENSAEFLQYMLEYRKVYTSETELAKRFDIWLQNKHFIESHNLEAAQGKHSYTMAMNQFGDMTHEEYKATMLRFKIPTDSEHNSEQVDDKDMSLTFIPNTVDWRAKGYVTNVGDQGQCGSCWAFTATGALEGQYKKATGKLVKLSEQNLMDCSAKEGNQGCNGGWMDMAFKYIKINGGIDTNQSYPYNLTNPGTYKCRYTKPNRGATCSGYVDLPKSNETTLQIAIATIGPISTAVDASHQGFEFYKSGVYDDPQCSSQNIDHSLVVTGYGIENGKEYYECKNSWGITWGNQGYIRMVRNKNNQCGIATIASYPTV